MENGNTFEIVVIKNVNVGAHCLRAARMRSSSGLSALNCAAMYSFTVLFCFEIPPSASEPRRCTPTSLACFFIVSHTSWMIPLRITASWMSLVMAILASTVR